MAKPHISSATPTVTVGAYSANDVVGGTLTFPDMTHGIIRGITLADENKQAGAYQVVFFDALPTDIADNATYDIADADLRNVIAGVHITDTAGADKFDLSDNKVYSRQGLNIPFTRKDDAVATYAFLIALGTPTYAAVNDVQIRVLWEE